MAEQRAQRTCDYCGKTDDAPHHQVVVPGPAGLVMLSGHFNCCRDRGCPDESCHQAMSASGSPPNV